MPTPDVLDDPRFSPFLAELRAASPRAPQALRERVGELGAREPRWPASAARFSLRRALLVLAPVSLAVVVTAAVLRGLTDSGPRGSLSGTVATTPSLGERRRPATDRRDEAARAAPSRRLTPLEAGSDLEARAALPPSTGRLQRYDVGMRLRVKNVDALSNATTRALRLTRRLGGYVVAVDYGTPGGRRGDASVRVRVPVSRVQDAIVHFSALGTIVSQRISIDDVQQRVDRLGERIAAVQRRVSVLRSSLQNGSLAAGERVLLQARLDGALRELRTLVRQRQTTVRRARYASVSLALTTRKAAAAATPSRESRFERAAKGGLEALAAVGTAALYVSILLSPLLLLSALGVPALRAHRRRSEERLLASS